MSSEQLSESPPPLRVVLVEDHLLFRESFRIALAVQGGFIVQAEASSARDAYALVEEHRPDVVVTDLMLTDTDGVSLIRELKRRLLTVPVLLVSRLSHPLFIKDAFRAGAAGYALKDDPLEEIVRGIRTVAEGRRHISSQLPAPGTAGAEMVRGSPLESLSRREREVFGRMLEGLTAKEIARSLCVSVKTVNTHRLTINRKLGVHSPAQFARMAATQGLIAR